MMLIYKKSRAPKYFLCTYYVQRRHCAVLIVRDTSLRSVPLTVANSLSQDSDLVVEHLPFGN